MSTAAPPASPTTRRPAASDVSRIRALDAAIERLTALRSQWERGVSLAVGEVDAIDELHASLDEVLS